MCILGLNKYVLEVELNRMPETAVVQKRLGGKGLIVYLVLLSTFVPMSTDLTCRLCLP